MYSKFCFPDATAINGSSRKSGIRIKPIGTHYSIGLGAQPAPRTSRYYTAAIQQGIHERAGSTVVFDQANGEGFLVPINKDFSLNLIKIII